MKGNLEDTIALGETEKKVSCGKQEGGKKQGRKDFDGFFSQDELKKLENVYIKLATTVVFRNQSVLSLSLSQCYFSNAKNCFIVFESEEDKSKFLMVYPSNIQFVKVGYPSLRNNA